ncbi:hypothetical protein cypCar_00000519 [Cyprinus carpio]|nr:hypothetical protein cypCar_00000519 [Cyprinus carpio]
MGDQDSGDSDGSPKNSPQKSVRPDALVKSVLQRQLSDQSSYRLDKSSRDMVKYLTNITADLSQSYHLHTSREIHPSITLEPSPNYNSPKFRSRNQSYMRAVSTLSQASCVSQVSQVSEAEVNGQFESVCESVFSEVESQAMDALDLPGCFRTRSHSYLRAIQAGFSQDDDCVPSMTSSTVTSTIRSTTEGNDVLEGTGLLNEDNFPSEGPDLTSMARRNAGLRGRGDESSTLYGDSSPTTTPSLPPLKTNAPIRPRPVQSSVQETADLALAISQQWREDVSAMRKELAELRKDLCTELRAFNRNFSTFTQHYSTWSPNWVRETQTAAPQVSVSTQAGSKTLVRQNTADAAVNCPSPVDPNVLSMSPSEPTDKNVLQVSASSPFFQTDPNSELADIDDPTFANLTPPDPIDVASLCWPDLDSDSMTPPDPPDPVPEVEPSCFTKSSTPEHVESVVLDFTNVELVNLASLQWPKLDPDDTGSPPLESLDRLSQESLEQPGTYTPDHGSMTTQQQSVLESMQPLLLSHTDEEPMDFTSLEMDSVVLSPVTLDSMNLRDLKWPSLESLELNVSGSQSPCAIDLALPNPPTPESVYECSYEATVQEPPLPELLDTIYLQPATPEPESRTESDISNPASPEPNFPTCQKPGAHELDTQALVLWSKRETFMGCAEEGIQFHLPSSGSVDRPSQQPPAVTYTPSTPTYKRTPPPVPPRSTSKPLISITAQSSTESTQDAYHEGQLARGAVRLIVQGQLICLICNVEAATDSECESKGSREYHSIGIQVEDERRQGRFKRSNSVTAAVQADLELEGFPLMEDKGLQFGGGFHRHSEPSTPTQYGAVRTVRTQGLFSYREDYRTPTEPSSPQRSPEPWLEPSPREPVATVAVTVTPPQPTDSGRASPSCRRDGSWFMQLLHTETKKMEGWCKELEGEAEENDLSEEILGKIRSAVGSAQLLMSQKFQQFYWLCQQNLDPSAMPRPTSQDLAGFWDLLQLSIDDVTSKFNELQKIKSNNWRLIESPVKKVRADF